MKSGRERRSHAISTQIVAIIVVVVIVIAAVSIYFATSTPSSKTATTSSTILTTSTSLTTSSTSSSSAYTVDITIPLGAGNASHPNNFIPNTVSVIAGTTIVFVNNDTGVIHDINFTSYPSGVHFSPNPSPLTSQWTNNMYGVTLTVPGTYVYKCDFHFWMTGVIQVN
jgi:plastocyanin